MPAVPPKLEAMAGFCVPPACREELLGDLCERYSSPGQYMILALRTIPFVIVSRIRRTTDAQVLLMEALLLCASFLAAAWYADKTLLIGQWGLIHLAIPAVLTPVVLILDDAWALRKRSPLRLVLSAAIGIGF